MQNVLKMHRATDKMGMAVKRAMELEPEMLSWDRTALLAHLHAAVDAERWVESEMYTAVLWYREWTQFLGRDFVEEGDEPEHTQWCPSADEIAKRRKAREIRMGLWAAGMPA